MPENNKWYRSAKFEVYSVGRNAVHAIQNLAEEFGWGRCYGFEVQPTEVPAEWYITFLTEDGTSMKASGEYITGGAILTWWK